MMKFICTECGAPRDTPCHHWQLSEMDQRWKFVASAVANLVALETKKAERTPNLERFRDDDGIKKILEQIIANENILISEADLILEAINRLVNWLQAPHGMEIRQLNHNKEQRMSTPAGGTSVFQEVPTPAGSIFPSGTTFAWTVDDTADITLTPSSDGTQVSAVCVASPTRTSYNLTCTSNYTPPGAPTPISATVNVPIIPAGPVTPTGMQINQLS
jgi:hypothetical protein